MKKVFQEFKYFINHVAQKVAKLQAYMVLAFVYIVLVTPLALIFRFTKQYALFQNSQSKSNWTTKNTDSIDSLESMRKQY